MEFLSFYIAKKLKEKGFPQHWSDQHYILENEYEDDFFEVGSKYPVEVIYDYIPTIAAPTISQVLKWLREAKRIDSGALWDNADGKWIGYVKEMDMPGLAGEYVLPNTYDTYEQAAIAGIEYVLDNLI